MDFLPDLMLLDHLLTDGNGIELCRVIKSHPKLKHIPVVIFTVYLPKGTNPGSYACEALISKPFDLDELVKKIHTMLTPDIV